MATPDRGLLDKALNIINNVGNYGPLDATIDSYKQAADYADDAKKYSELAQASVVDIAPLTDRVTNMEAIINSLIERVTALENKG